MGELKTEPDDDDDDVALSKVLAKEDVREKALLLVSSFRNGGRLTNLDKSATIGSIRVRFCLLLHFKREEKKRNVRKFICLGTV